MRFRLEADHYLRQKGAALPNYLDKGQEIDLDQYEGPPSMAMTPLDDEAKHALEARKHRHDPVESLAAQGGSAGEVKLPAGDSRPQAAPTQPKDNSMPKVGMKSAAAERPVNPGPNAPGPGHVAAKPAPGGPALEPGKTLTHNG